MGQQTYLYAVEICVLRDGEKCAACGWTYGDRPTKIQKQHPLPEGVDQRLQLNHIDGNPANNRSWNWNLLCRTCNLWDGMERQLLGTTARTTPRTTARDAAAGNGERGNGGQATGGATARGGVDRASEREMGAEGSGERGRVAKRNRKGIDTDRNGAAAEKKMRGSSTWIVRQQVPYREGEPSMQANSIFEPRVTLYLLEQTGRRGHWSLKEARAAAAEYVGCSPQTVERYLTKLTSIEGPFQIVIDVAGERVLTFRIWEAPEEEKPKRRRRAG